MAMLFKKSPDIATGFLNNTPMLSAGDGLKAGVSAFKSALQGATSSAGIVGGGMATVGKIAQGKAVFKEKDIKDKDGNVTKVGEKVKLSKDSLKSFAKGDIERVSPPPGNHSGIKKDMKKAWANMPGLKGKSVDGSRTRDSGASVKQSYKDARRGDTADGKAKGKIGAALSGAKAGGKTLVGINPDKHTKGQKGTAVKNHLGKQLTGAGHLVKGVGQFMGEKGLGGKTLGKTLGALERMAPGDTPAPTVLAMINFDVQN